MSSSPDYPQEYTPQQHRYQQQHSSSNGAYDDVREEDLFFPNGVAPTSSPPRRPAPAQVTEYVADMGQTALTPEQEELLYAQQRAIKQWSRRVQICFALHLVRTTRDGRRKSQRDTQHGSYTHAWCRMDCGGYCVYLLSFFLRQVGALLLLHSYYWFTTVIGLVILFCLGLYAYSIRQRQTYFVLLYVVVVLVNLTKNILILYFLLEETRHGKSLAPYEYFVVMWLFGDCAIFTVRRGALEDGGVHVQSWGIISLIVSCAL